MSYNGHLGFGLLGDYDALPDLDAIADDLKWAIASLHRAAGLRPTRGAGANAKPPPASARRATSGRRAPAARSSKPASAG